MRQRHNLGVVPCHVREPENADALHEMKFVRFLPLRDEPGLGMNPDESFRPDHMSIAAERYEVIPNSLRRFAKNRLRGS